MSKQVVTGFLSLIKQIFTGKQLDVQFSPIEPLRKGEMAIGTVHDRVLRALYSESRVLSNTAVKEQNAEVLLGLFWEGLCASLHDVSLGLRVGWQVVHLEGEANISLFPAEHPSSTFFEDVKRAMSAQDGGDLEVFGSKLSPVNGEAEEFRLGKISSPTLKSLFIVRSRLGRMINENILESRRVIFTGGRPSADVVKNLFMKYKRLSNQHFLLGQIFWLGVEEEIPATAKDGNFSLRKDWEVVRIPKDQIFSETDGGLMMLILPIS